MNISIFITSYNQKKYLTEAIESALCQTLKPVQIIIVDDCSNDGSQDVIAGYRSRFPGLIVPIYHKKNTGVSQVRIDALNAVKGDYVTYMDGDDRFLPGKLEKEMNVFNKQRDAHIAFSNNFYMNEEGVHNGVWAEDERPPEGNVFCQTFARDFPRNNLFRMELVNYRAWKETGFHDPKLKIYEDYDMRIRLTKNLRTVYCDEPLSEIRVHEKGLSKAGPAQHLEALEYIYQKNKHLMDDVNREERTHVQKKLFKWFARIARTASLESLKANRRLQSARFLFSTLRYDASIFDWRLAVRACIPNLYGSSRSI